jgi:hypothetical protein
MNEEERANLELRIRLAELPKQLQDLQASWSRKQLVAAFLGPLLIALIGAAASGYSAISTSNSVSGVEAFKAEVQRDLERIRHEAAAKAAEADARRAAIAKLYDLLIRSMAMSTPLAERGQGLATVCNAGMIFQDDALVRLAVSAGESFSTMCMDLCPQMRSRANSDCGSQCDAVSCWFTGKNCVLPAKRLACAPNQ